MDPLRETAHCALMQALADENDVAAISLAYRDLRVMLHQQGCGDPTPETTALFHRLRSKGRGGIAAAKQVTQTLAAPQAQTPNAGLEDAAPGVADRVQGPGREGIRDQGPVMDAEPGMADTVIRRPRCALIAARRLSQALIPLIGREDLLQEARGCLATACLVTLTGTGGVGKTRLAIELALAEARERDAWFVECAPLSDPAHLARTIATAIGVPEERDIPIEEDSDRFSLRPPGPAGSG